MSQGRRVDHDPAQDADQYPFPRLQPGDYGKDVDGVWHCWPPAEPGPGCLAKHTVVEHEDGTITVSPSILISNHKGSWHGYLERGVWREC